MREPAFAEVILDVADESICKRIRGELPELCRRQILPAGDAELLVIAGAQSVEIALHLVVVRELSCVDVAARCNRIVDVRGAKVDRHDASVQAIEKLLGDPTIEHHVLITNGESIAAHRLVFVVYRPTPRLTHGIAELGLEVAQTILPPT